MTWREGTAEKAVRVGDSSGRGEYAVGRGGEGAATEISFTVLGKPKPAGSKRAFPIKGTNRIAVTDANPEAKAWKQEVASVARLAYDCERLLDGPLRLTVVFYLARPKAHFRTGKHEGEVKLSASAYPTTRPDTTKLLRGVEDALTGVLWRDDAQVIDQRAWKLYGAPERCEVTVRRL